MLSSWLRGKRGTAYEKRKHKDNRVCTGIDRIGGAGDLF